ncbi:MAG TPA: hypothetical protein VJV75_08750, partial [Candidatus Polarisedimenticolia bacterium]|nr:hypothetical protein [Candidatus Polarisedimenticolia bacterium]
WELQGKASVGTYLGRPCLVLDNGGAFVKDYEFRDGVIDVDMAATGARVFAGLHFRLADDGRTSEWVYLRPHKSGLPDALQYTPIFNTGSNWQIYSNEGFTAPADIPREKWFHVRLEVTGAQARLFLEDMQKPVLVMGDLKSGRQRGSIGLEVGNGAVNFSNFSVRATPDAPFERHLPPMRPGTIAKWSLSPAFDALARPLERMPTAAEIAAMKWQEVEAEPPGFVVLYRYLDAPHLRVTFQEDFSTRMQPQPGMQGVYARTRIDSDHDQTRALDLGYSDDVVVFLNGRILWRGRSAQRFRDPGFLGIMDVEDDTVYLPLKKGANDLVLALAELGGGWGFTARLRDLPR